MASRDRSRPMGARQNLALCYNCQYFTQINGPTPGASFCCLEIAIEKALTVRKTENNDGRYHRSVTVFALSYSRLIVLSINSGLKGHGHEDFADFWSKLR